MINTLDPGKATLIPEFYVIWGLYNALMKFDAKMNPVPDLAESVRASRDKPSAAWRGTYLQRVDHLQTSVHLEKIKIKILVHDKLDSAGTCIIA